MKDFRGKVAVVTGAASGIGRAIALRLRDEGMRIVLADVDAGALDAVAGEIVAGGGEAIGVRTDVSRRDDVEALARAAIDAFGGVHLVCNNAGVHGPQDEPIWEATDADWQLVMGVNFGGVINGVGVFLPLLAAHDGETHIVNTASMTGLVQGANVYSVSKHATISYTEALYSDLNQRKINVGVSVLCPGFANTALLRPSDEAADGESKRRKSMAAMLARTSLQYASSAESVADAMVEGVQRNQLYIRTTDDWDALIKERVENVLAGANPVVQPGLSVQSRWPWPRPPRPRV